MHPKQDYSSHLFMVRLWSEEAVEAGVTRESKHQQSWRGRVQHVLSGEARTFHDWTTLIELLLEMSETDEFESKAQDGEARRSRAAIRPGSLYGHEGAELRVFHRSVP